MTNRERLLAFLSGDALDRVPIWLLFPYDTVPYYADVWHIPAYKPITELGLERAVWLNRRGFGVPLFKPSVEHTTEELEENGVRIKRSTLRCGAISLSEETRVCGDRTDIEKLISSEEDFAKFAQLPLETDRDVIHKTLDAQIARFHAEKAEFPSHLGSMMASLGEPIGDLYGRSKLEELAIWSLTMPDDVVALLDRLQERHRIIYEYLLENGAADLVFMVGSEFASPPLVSRRTFQRWIVPYAQELIDIVHRHGGRVIQHYHGQIREILPDFLTMAPDGLHTIEAPPTGNCTLTEAFDVVGDRIGLIGNIQYDEFRRLTPDEMDAAVKACIYDAQGHRFMLSPTAGPYEADIGPRVQENYLRFIESGWRYGCPLS